jgi:hypothetical protein
VRLSRGLAAHVAHGLPAAAGFSESFAMAAAFLIACMAAATLVPSAGGYVPGVLAATAD